jgi:hypothetical protein
METEPHQPREEANIVLDSHDTGADKQAHERDDNRVMHPAPALAPDEALPTPSRSDLKARRHG